ncbi:MAG: radical SAM protein [Desulfobacula sp.]|nr:radical SAM protein [Desulfobacula sp.]
MADAFICARYGFSPYHACEHGCIYCDGRAEKYYVKGEFDKDIVIRQNLPELLQQELPKLRERGFISIGSGVSDAYQPVEAKEFLMKKTLKILTKFHFPVSLMTKSSLPLRDIELSGLINEQSKFMLIVSLTTLDDSIRKIFEPTASSIQSRLNMIREFKKIGCTIGILAMPLLPYITETNNNCQQLYSTLKDLGVDFIMPGGLTLRPGKQKDIFMALLKKRYPNLIPKYEQIYYENKQSGSPSYLHMKKMANLYHALPEQYAISTQVPHYVFKNETMLYDEINILMSHMCILYKRKGHSVNRLQASQKRFQEWVINERKPYNRSRKKSHFDIEDKIKELLKNGKMAESIFKNKKLGDFFNKIILESAVFDYTKLEILKIPAATS